MSSVKGTALQGLIGATIGFFVGFAAVSLFGSTVGYLQTTVGLSAGLAGLLISIPNLTGSLLRIPFSARVDKDGGRQSFLILLVASAIGLAGIWFLLTFFVEQVEALFPLLLLFGALGGCGIATFSVGISQTSYWYPQRSQGAALGAYAGIGNIAPGLFALLLGLLIPLVGLSDTYLLWFAFLILGIGAYALLGKNAPYFQLRKAGSQDEPARERARSEHNQEFFPKGSAKETLAASARVWQTWALVLVYFTTFGGFVALTGWFPKYWSSFFGLELGVAGALTAAFSVSASLLRVAGGSVADKLGGEATALAALGTLAVGAVLMGVSSVVALSVVGFAFLAVGMGVANGAVFKLVPQEVPQAISGAAGWVGGLGAFGGFVIPNLMALFLGEAGLGDVGYARGFLLFVAFSAVSATMIILMRLARSRRDVEAHQ